MLKVVITGGMGSGKSTVANLFAEHGADIIDADVISHQLSSTTGAAYSKIVEHFSIDILSPDKTINRSKLRAIVFNQPEQKLWLENLLHPLIRLEIETQVDACQSPYCIIVIPLLQNREHYHYINRVCVVDIDPALQLERASQRDDHNTQAMQKIVDSQISRDKRLTLADDIITNNGTIDDLRPQVEKLHQFYLQQ